jgi:hypothetical protein
VPSDGVVVLRGVLVTMHATAVFVMVVIVIVIEMLVIVGVLRSVGMLVIVQVGFFACVFDVQCDRMTSER